MRRICAHIARSGPVYDAALVQPYVTRSSNPEANADMILRQTPTIFTKSWGAGSIAPPLAVLCLVPVWSQGPTYKTSQRHCGAVVLQAQILHDDAPAGRQLQVRSIRRSYVATPYFRSLGGRSFWDLELELSDFDKKGTVGKLCS
eukprot:351557-Chlamydomonas_euryale.AAC.31